MLILLFISFFANAGSRESIRESIEQVISERHPTDKKETWFAMGEDAPNVIMEMLGEGVDAYKRVRLLEALGNFKSSEVSEFLKREAKNAKNPQYRMSSVKGLLKSEGEGAIEFAKEFLEDSDPDVQKIVAQSIKRLGTIRAEQVTSEYFEKHPQVKIKPSGKLKPSGTNESKPELSLLGQWSGYTLMWDPKKKQIIPKKVFAQFDMGLGDHLILRTKLEDQKVFTTVNIEKEKWKWSNPDQPEILELVSESKKLRFFLSPDIR